VRRELLDVTIDVPDNLDILRDKLGVDAIGASPRAWDAHHQSRHRE
jgi:hypothetical protein